MVSTIRAWFRSLVDIRRVEYKPVALMLGYGFLALTSYYVIKPARNSIFVDRVGADALPVVYLLTAVVVVGVMVVYSRYVEKVGRLTLLLSSMGFLAASLVFFWWLLRGGSGVVASGAFYIFVKLYPLFLVSQFWLVANLLFSTSQARRLFGPIGMGLILGGIAGSSIAGFASERVGTEFLLLVATGILGLCALLVMVLGPRIRKGSGGDASLTGELSGSALQLLRQSSHLRTIAWILGLTIVVGTLLDWQLNRAVELFVEGEDAKTAFWGQFYAVLNVASVAIQLLLTSFVLRRFGVSVALFILPVALAAGSIGIFFIPALWMVAFGKGAEGALRYSLDQSTRELLFLPVPTQEKYKVKPLIDLAIYRGGTGFGGILLLIFVNAMGLPLRWISLVTLGAIAAWLYFAWRMRREFAQSLRRLIGVQDVKLEELLVKHLSKKTRRELESALERGDEREVLYALSLLEQVPSSKMIDPLRRLLREHESQQVRGRTLEILTKLEAEEAVEDVTPLLDDESVYVRAEAVWFLSSVGENGAAAERLEEFLENDDPVVEMGAVGCLLRYGDEGQRARGLERLRAMALDEDPAYRRATAVFLGRMDPFPAEGEELLDTLIADPDSSVCHAAMEAVGRSGDLALLPLLLGRLRDPAYRGAAAEALAGYGSAVHEDLLDLLGDDEESLDTRVHVPSLLVDNADQDTVERLWALMPGLPRTLRYHTLKTLNKLRRNREDLTFQELELEGPARAELAEAARHMVRFEDLQGDTDDRGEHDLLDKLLLQRHHEAAERAVRILALQIPQEDLYAGFRAFSSKEDVTRQRGFELMDTLMPQELRTAADPLLNPDSDPRQRANMVSEQFGVERGDAEATLRRLTEEDDLWLAMLARRRLGEDPVWDAPDDLGTRIRTDAPLQDATVIPSEEAEFMEVLERGEALREAKIFRDLRVEDLAAIAALCEERSYEKNSIVFEEGAPGGTLHVVVEGRVEARKGDRVLYTAGPGRSVGSLSLLDGLPSNYTAVAVEPTQTLRLEREPFRTLLMERGPAVMSVLEYITGVVRGLNDFPNGDDDGDRAVEGDDGPDDSKWSGDGEASPDESPSEEDGEVASAAPAEATRG